MNRISLRREEVWAYETVYAEESVGAKTEKHKMAGSRQRTTSSDVTGAWSLRHRDKARR